MVNQPEGPTLRNCLKQKKNNYPAYFLIHSIKRETFSKSSSGRASSLLPMIPRRESGSSIGAKKRVGVKSKYSMMLNSSRRGHRNSIGDASDVGAALSKLQAHPMLRNTLLFPQLCDAVPHKRFIAAVVVHDPLPPISAYYFNIRERCEFAFKSSTFASHNE